MPHAEDRAPHHPFVSLPAGPGRLIVSLGLTLAFALAEFAVAEWSHSLALLGDAGHMFTDSLGLVIATFGAWLARRPPSKHQTYGWGRAEVIAAAMNALLMLALVVGLATLAVNRIEAERTPPVTGWAVLVTGGGGLLLNLFVLGILRTERPSLNIRAVLLHVLGDLLGSCAAFVAGLVIVSTGWMMIDPILSLFIAGLILVSSVRLFGFVGRVLLEGVPYGLDVEQIGASLARVEGVRSIHDLHVWALSSEQVALSAHVVVERLEDWPALLEKLGGMLIRTFGIHHATFQPEPTVQKIPVPGHTGPRRAP